MPSTLFGTGINGLVGSKFRDMFGSVHTIYPLDVTDQHNPVDITNPDQVMRALSSSNAEFVLHLAAYTDVTGAWKQSGDKTGSAYKVNVEGTQNIITACEQLGLHLIHISTAYVFDGTKEGLYLETDPVSPIEWYGQTKAEAEALVTASSANWTILRIDQPFRSELLPNRPDTAHRIAAGLKAGTLYPQFTNHYFGPTYIDDFAQVIDWVLRTKTTGLFNAASGEQWTDYAFATAIAKQLGTSYQVEKGDLTEYLKNLGRPYQKNTAMSSEKLAKVLDFSLTPIETALKEVQF